MKILIASDLHYPTINGVATFSRNLAKGLADRGHDVLVIAPSQTGKKSKEVDGNHVIVSH
jgi:glycogen synthase